jgi:hypothetical protein
MRYLIRAQVFWRVPGSLKRYAISLGINFIAGLYPVSITGFIGVSVKDKVTVALSLIPTILMAARAKSPRLSKKTRRASIVGTRLRI